MGGYAAHCDARGVRRDVSLFLLSDQIVAVGDYVLVHVGYAIQMISAADARATWELFDEVAVALDRADA
jgi:hydrogenase expression/formation protein HypC